MKDFIDALKDREYLYQSTNTSGLKNLFLSQKDICAYIGFDCTASCLHVGSLVQIMVMRLLISYGVKVIALLGGATTRIGDPSGKDKTRSMLSYDDIENNKLGIRKILEKFFNQDEITFADNEEWFDNLNYIEFLREIGSKFSVNRMINFESVRLRLDREQHLSFLEFNYLILQAYDFVQLNKKYGCNLQIGGADQWGNIVSGIELGRRLGLTDELFGITTPLLTTASGAKMGKTADGAIWLGEELLSVYDYWQYFRNVDDRDLEKWLKMFTDISLDKIHSYCNGDYNINDVKKILANDVTTICHGEKKALQALETATAIFENPNMQASINIPEIILQADQIPEEGMFLFKILSEFNILTSSSAAKKMLQSSAIKVSNEIVSVHYKIYKHDLQKEALYISVGKKKKFKLLLG